ncbi:MAG: DUF99 family protein [Polyangiaceae bacterium]
MARTRWAHVIGVDDAPFPGSTAAMCSSSAWRCRGAASTASSTHVRRDGKNATSALAEMIRGSQFIGHLQAVLLQGIALAGFNVVDIHALHEELQRPVLVMARKPPDMPAIRRALLLRVPGGEAKWQLIEKAGPMEQAGNVLVQRAGLDLDEARALLDAFLEEGNVPEPLRLAHLIAGGVTTGKSRGRA